ncbi:uncharacterized protein N7459_000439 [Penicillium hispanicum]|uniref:uncharacterized protein n=1 Tax=Penicillium hispanicum TaxID=1080232 RepID=UPI0025416608|nr:uncharacterized protein N7459_000439 [Penicillium hispanicum]KAJ5594231.1 hypothetical protein N7459_000439 [Penicillium hispanicum]
MHLAPPAAGSLAASLGEITALAAGISANSRILDTALASGFPLPKCSQVLTSVSVTRRSFHVPSSVRPRRTTRVQLVLIGAARQRSRLKCRRRGAMPSTRIGPDKLRDQNGGKESERERSGARSSHVGFLLTRLCSHHTADPRSFLCHGACLACFWKPSSVVWWKSFVAPSMRCPAGFGVIEGPRFTLLRWRCVQNVKCFLVFDSPARGATCRGCLPKPSNVKRTASLTISCERQSRNLFSRSASSARCTVDRQDPSQPTQFPIWGWTDRHQ